jgi:hypothetical protein
MVLPVIDSVLPEWRWLCHIYKTDSLRPGLTSSNLKGIALSNPRPERLLERTTGRADQGVDSDHEPARYPEGYAS